MATCGKPLRNVSHSHGRVTMSMLKSLFHPLFAMILRRLSISSAMFRGPPLTPAPLQQVSCSMLRLMPSYVGLQLVLAPPLVPLRCTMNHHRITTTRYIPPQLLSLYALPPTVLPPNVLPPTALPPNVLPPTALPPIVLPPIVLPPVMLSLTVLPPPFLPQVAVLPCAILPYVCPPHVLPSNV
jgi:hypothetical protein